jgi:general secretion pathway protein F
MALFHYRALASDGTELRGGLDAADREAAARCLHQRGLLVMHVEAGMASRLQLRRRTVLRADALFNFTQQLATLLGAGQSLEQALGVLVSQPGREGQRGRPLIERVRERVKEGYALSSAMAEEHGQFSPLYLSLVRAGEASGALQQTLHQLADYLERRQVLRGEITNALIYPAFLLTGVLGALLLLMGYVVPQFVPIFQDLGVPLPLITEAILGCGLFIAGNWLWLAAVGALLLLAGSAYWRQPAQRLRLDRRLLGLPVVGGLWQRLEAARLARTLGTLLRNGVPMLSALAMAAQVCANRAIAQRLALALELVGGGGSLASALNDDRLLPSLALQMIAVGEQAGQLDHMLLKVADVFDQQARRSIAALLAALVPTLTLVMAVLVGIIMLAIMLPLMSLTSNI